MTYDRICLMLPTRGRCRKNPEKNPDGNDIWEGKLVDFLQSSMEMTERPTSEVVDYLFMVNENDQATLDFLIWRMQGYKFQILTENDPEINISGWFNRMYAESRFNRPETLVSLLGDDMIFKTKGYDQAILNAVNECDGNALVYCNDAYCAGENCCVNLFTTRKVVEATGKPYMKADHKAEMIDDVWIKIAKMVNIQKYLPDTVILHDHFTKLPEPEWDETAKRLTPVQRAEHAARDLTAEQAYVNEVAKTLISKGIGHLG